MRPARSLASGGLALLSFVAALWAYPRTARANGFEIPENGTEVMGRGGAWVARADNPLAAALNPAGLAGLKSGIILNANLTWQAQCFQKAGNYPTGADNQFTAWQSNFTYEGQPYPEVCKSNGLKDVNVVPQLGFNYKINDKLGVAFLPVWSPSGTGKAKWPTEVDLANGSSAPSPTRFLLVEKNARIIMPTFAAGYEVTKGVRLGLAFQWVITMFKSSLMSQGSQTTDQSVKQGPGINTMSEVSWNQWFTPAAVAGVMISPTDDIDIGGMFRYSADIVKKGGDVTITAPFYGNGKGGSVPTETDVKVKEMRLVQPMDIRIGVRFHPARKGVTLPTSGRRDFLTHDSFDIELDLTYSRNSSFDQLTVLFDPGQRVNFGTTVGASIIPENASIQKNWKDTYGARLGGEYNAIPEKLGIRAGAFFQTKGQDEQYLNLDFHPGQMFGFYVGATARVTKSLDLSVGYGHIFVKAFDNTKEGGKLRALIASEPDNANGPDYYTECNQPGVTQPSQPFRSCAIVNTGRMTSSYNIFSLGGTYHF
jgi:long-subunit fatty acid transport protein